jgi:chromosome segregation ATPase
LFQEDPPVRKSISDCLENFEVELDNGEFNGIDIDTIISSFGKIVKGFQLRNKHIADRFDVFSDSIDDFISPIHGKLLETESNIVAIVEHMEVMRQKAYSVTTLSEEKDSTIAALENDINLLLSACTDSTSELQNEVHQNLGQLGSTFEVEKLNYEADEQVEHHKNSKYADASRKLINASGKVQTLIKQFKFKSEQVDATVRDLQTKLNETTVAFELATEERDLNKDRVMQLESDIQSLQSTCSELKHKVEGYHVLEEELKKKEEEISSMHSALSAKEGIQC